MKSLRVKLSKYKSYILLGLVILLALYVFIPQLDQLKDAIKTLKDADKTWVVVGLAVFFSGIIMLTWQFMALAFKPLRFVLTFRVEMASLFVSKLMPIGLGTIAINMFYLLKEKHTKAETGSVLAMNALTSGIAYSLLIIFALIETDFSAKSIFSQITLPEKAIKVIVGLLIAAVVALILSQSLRKKIANSWHLLTSNIKTYKKRPKKLLIGVVANGVGSFTSLFALYASAQAISVHITLAEALLAYTFGNIAATLVPTPGGLGAAEAGIYAGLLMVGVDTTEAISITLLYRLISYWIPIIPGYYFFWDLRKTLLSDFSLKKSQKIEAMQP